MPSALEVLQSSNCWDEIVDKVAVALLILDSAQEIVLANQQVQRLFGYSRHEMIGRNVDLFVPKGQIDWGSSQAQLPAQNALGVRKDALQVSLEVTVDAVLGSSETYYLACFSEKSAPRGADFVEQQMAAIIESAEDAIITKGLDGVIRSWNPGAERLLGYRAEEVVGGPVTRLIPQHLQDEEAMILRQLRKGQRVTHFETIRRKRDGSDVHVSLTISPIRNRTGVIVGASKIMRDITDRRQVEMNLRRSNSELERTNAELDEFVYTASHDLRSPLSNVSSVAQWILDDDGSLSAQTRDRLLLIQGRIERMKRLLDDIRDYARSGTMEEFGGPPMSAADLLVEAVDSLHIPPGFSVQVNPKLNDVKIKRSPLTQVFNNLINNAIKHHDQATGQIEVTVDTSGSMYRFAVRDDGPGIPKAYREEIFGMFKTLKPRDQVEGSGMGLALVRKIVSRMGGQCGVDAITARGAEFWFDWPKMTSDSDSAP